MKLERPITTIEEYINISEALDKILRETSEVEGYLIERFGDTIEASYYYAYKAYLSKQKAQIERVKLKGIEGVLRAIRRNLPNAEPISRTSSRFGVLFYNIESGELDVSFHESEDCSYLDRLEKNKNIYFEIIRRVVTMDEIESWVFAVNGVMGYECCRRIR